MNVSTQYDGPHSKGESSAALNLCKGDKLLSPSLACRVAIIEDEPSQNFKPNQVEPDP